MKEITSEMALAKRKELKLNQSDFWKKVKVTQSGGSRYESGRPLPNHVQIVFNLVYGTDKEAEKLFRALREK